MSRKSAWDKGVEAYMEMITQDVERPYTEKKLLNGASSWREYSYAGWALCYDTDIAALLCSPSELKARRNGLWNPNKRETWLDVQARALWQAARRVLQEEACVQDRHTGQ